jgi:hypothetical protein
MEHRHLKSGVGWTKAAIDSALERGSLAEWRELFDEVRQDGTLAAKVLDVARRHPMPGVLPLVAHIIRLDWPELLKS